MPSARRSCSRSCWPSVSTAGAAAFASMHPLGRHAGIAGLAAPLHHTSDPARSGTGRRHRHLADRRRRRRQAPGDVLARPPAAAEAPVPWTREAPADRDRLWSELIRITGAFELPERPDEWRSRCHRRRDLRPGGRARAAAPAGASTYSRRRAGRRSRTRSTSRTTPAVTRSTPGSSSSTSATIRTSSACSASCGSRPSRRRCTSPSPTSAGDFGVVEPTAGAVRRWATSSTRAFTGCSPTWSGSSAKRGSCSIARGTASRCAPSRLARLLGVLHRATDHPQVSAVGRPTRGSVVLPGDFLARSSTITARCRPGGRPRWRSIVGGSRRYVDALVAPFRDRIRLATPVRESVGCPTGSSSRPISDASHTTRS